MDRYRYATTTATMTAGGMMPTWSVSYHVEPAQHVLTPNDVIAILIGDRTLANDDVLPTGTEVVNHPEIPGMRLLNYDGYQSPAAWYWDRRPDRLWIKDIITEKSLIWRAVQRVFREPEGMPRRRGWNAVYEMTRKETKP